MLHSSLNIMFPVHCVGRSTMFAWSAFVWTKLRYQSHPPTPQDCPGHSVWARDHRTTNDVRRRHQHVPSTTRIGKVLHLLDTDTNTRGLQETATETNRFRRQVQSRVWNTSPQTNTRLKKPILEMNWQTNRKLTGVKHKPQVDWCKTQTASWLV